LKGSKQEVAVKVQYPEAGRLFSQDIHTIRKFCEALAPENVVLLEALEKQNAAELDYMKEAENLAEIRSNMKKHGFAPSLVVVPRALPELSTQRMLVMELLPGPKLIDGIRDFYSRWAEQNGTTLHDLEAEAREIIEKEGIPVKYDGPPAWKVGLFSKYVKLRDRVLNFGINIHNRTIGRGSEPIPFQESRIPPNTPRIIDTLMRVHGYQLLSDGVFNSGKLRDYELDTFMCL
jgi:aarF domain-containing kinase